MFNSLLLEFFQEALPLGVDISCSRDREVESVEIVQKLLPPGVDPGERWASQPLLKDQSGEVSRGHGCDGVDKGELLLGYE